MVFVTTGKQELALLLAGSRTDRPAYMAIGSGSGLATVSRTSLYAETDRNTFTTTDASVSQYITYTADFSSIDMSGTNLTEFGVTSSGLTMSGTLWNIETFQPAISFDGTNELQVQVTFQIF